MQYFAANYWESGNHSSALMLQQVYHKRRKLPILFTCVCSGGTDDGAGGEVVRTLTEWFYETGLSICGRRGQKGMHILGDSLKKCMIGCLGRKVQRLGEQSLAGVFCVGDSLIIFQQGSLPIHLLNMRNQRLNHRELQLEGEWGIIFQPGVIRPGVGILLATDGFYDSVSSEAVEECLNIRELRTRAQLENRLKELGRLGEVRGGTEMGAVLVMTK